MAKKHRKGAPRGKAKSAPASLSPAELEQVAWQALQDKRYREAIAHFKALLKQEPALAWREGLAQAYEGRATELTEKGMQKEALVIWQNRQQLGRDAAPPRLAHADLLLAQGQAEAAIALLDEAAEGLSSAQLKALRGKLAAYHLAGDTTILERLAADDPIRRHGEAAQAALSAYCTGDDEALEGALAKIPFRSPYRDLTQILKALQRLADQPAAASTLLAKVPETSAFAPLSRAAELAMLPEASLLARLGGLGESMRRFVLVLRGWGPERQAFYRALQRLGETPSPQALLNLMYRHQQSLGKAWVDDRGLRLLIDALPASLNWLKKCRPIKPSQSEMARLIAWHLEHIQADPWEILEAWDRVAEALEEEAPAPAGSDQALRIALALRRVDQTFRCLDAVPSGDPDCLDHEVANQVEHSLAYDPEDPEPYLRLHGYYLRGQQLKEARRIQQDALARWPRDIRVLTAALDTAVAGGAFKKAAGLARQILAIDPINRGARERLVKAHLAHAAKQIRAERPDLARRELEHAGQWDTQGRFSDRRDIVAALCRMSSDRQAGVAQLVERHARLGGGLTAQLVIALELSAAGIPPADLGRRTGLRKPEALDTQDLEAFMARLQALLSAERRLAEDLKRYFDAPLKAAARLPLSFAALEHTCETLRRCDWQGPRQAFAKSALKQWPQAPVFELHAFEAKYPRRLWLASDLEVRRLEAAGQRAGDMGDTRTELRIREILARLFPFPFDEPFGDVVLPEPDDTPLEVIDPEQLIREIRRHGVEALFDELDLDGPSRKLLRNLERQLGTEALAETLSEMLAEAPLPPAEPPRPKSTSRRKGGKHNDDPCNQPDLFS
jgi:cellulose synthase operon protein C